MKTFMKVNLTVKLLTLALLLLIKQQLFAQITSSTNKGCAPLVGVTFNGASGATNVNWDFGDKTSSTLLTPVHTYANAGNYTVTFTGTVSGSKVTYTLKIDVYSPPKANFYLTSSNKGCIALNVSFIDVSVGTGGGNIVTRLWNFGDGGTNTTASNIASYQYTTKGKFTPSLTVTDNNGCSATATSDTDVFASKPPVINLINNPTNLTSCTPPLTCSLDASTSVSNSSLTNKLTYKWTYQNNQTSTSSNINNLSYTTAGHFKIKLIVTDDNKCSDSTDIDVATTAPTNKFTIPDTSCGLLKIKDQLKGVYNYNNVDVYYDYGNGNTGIDTTINYAKSGYYTITMHTDSGICKNKFSKKVWIDMPIANFVYDSISGVCDMPANIPLTNTSKNAKSYQWTFHDSTYLTPYNLIKDYMHYRVTPTNSTLLNPTIQLHNLDTNRYNINNDDSLDKHVTHYDNVFVNLIATSAFGCKDTLRKLVTKKIFLANAQFLPSKHLGCAPLIVDFISTSWVDTTIASYTWIFGDGTPSQTQTTPTTNHTYANKGIYYPKLVITTINGCIDTSYTQKIEVGVAPKVNFSISPTTVCAGKPVTLKNLTPATDSVDTYHYYGDNNLISHCTNSANVTWNFKDSIGIQNITLVGSWKGCKDSLTKQITVNGPVVKLTSLMDCAKPHDINFEVDAKGATGWKINYGDGKLEPKGTQTTFIHNFVTSGEYWVKVNVENTSNTCPSVTDSVKVFVRDVKAVIKSANQNICYGSTVDSADFSVDLAKTVGITECSSGYTWLWGDSASGPSLTNSPVPNHLFKDNDRHLVRLIVKDENDCRDTTALSYKVFKTNPFFTASQPLICLIDTIQFTNASKSDTTITSYQWDFGDGKNSSQTSPTHIYDYSASPNIPDSFMVSLTANNAIGCSVFYNKWIRVSKPKPNLTSPGPFTICQGRQVSFNVIDTSYYNVVTYGDGKKDTIYTTKVHTFDSAGTFTPVYNTINKYGCVKNYTSTITVNVQQMPKAILSSSIDTAKNFCYPLTISFTDKTAGSHNRIWSFGSGAIVPNTTVSNSYNAPGKYTTTLLVSSTAGCVDTAVKRFSLYGPKADFTFSPSTICKYDSIKFAIKDTASLLTYHWDFGDGTDTTALDKFYHRYNFHPVGGKTSVTLVYWSQDSACVKSQLYPIEIRQVISDFDRNAEKTVTDSIHCFGQLETFTNKSNDAQIYSWNLGDGTTSSDLSPTHVYSKAGKYEVTLAVKNTQYECKDTILKTMVINPNPVAVATGGKICRGSSLEISGSGGLTYDWSPSATLSFPKDSATSASPTESTTYILKVTDSNNCFDTASAFVFVQQPPPNIDKDTTVVIGEKIPLLTNGGNTLTYKWSPTDSLICTSCENNESHTITDIKYSVEMGDTMACFKAIGIFNIKIKPLSSIDVPTAFTPNQDGNNDIVFVRGWGIKKLLYFKIYNRWGELIFESSDINVGWDGTFNGIPQGVEAYAYVAAAETYIDAEPLVKKGFIKLIR